jgi:hypothetical protein
VRYFAYIHGKRLQMAITDEDGVHVNPLVPLPESTSIRQQAISKLHELGYSPISRWNEFSDYSYAEVRKNG